MSLRPQIVEDVSRLPEFAFGSRSLVWWGILGFMLIEGTAFVVAAGSYLYLVGRSDGWPPPQIEPPDLLWGTLFTVGLILTEIPNHWTAVRAKRQEDRKVRQGVVLMLVLAALLLAVRAMEFPHLNVRWDANAYGSVTWLMMVLHTVHVITDVLDTAVLAVFLFTHEVRGKEHSQVADNCIYWSFVVWTWVPIYLLVYWAPRLL
jgi:heme/copper-type cytochrome/quinol oxidase subunit 3